MADPSAYSNPAKPPSTPTLPANPVPITFDGFDTLNTKPSQQGIGDQEMFVCDGFMPLGKNNLRALRGVGTSIFSTNPVKATGWVYFAVNPTAGQTVTLNGNVFTFVASGATTSNFQVNIGATTSVTIFALYTLLTTSATYLGNVGLNAANYYDGGGSTTDQLYIVYKTYGTGGNGYTLAASTASVSAATLTGGSGVTIDTFNFNTIAGVPVCIVSTDDGNLTQVNMNTLAQTVFPSGFASGYVQFGAADAANGDTVTLNGRTFTFVNDGSGWPTFGTNYKINISGTAGGTEFFFAQALTTGAHYLADTLLNVATYADGGGAGPTYKTNITYNTPGAGGNAYTLAKSSASIAVSAATLTGGASLITSFPPDYSQWSDEFILIVSPQSNGYIIWDGTHVFKTGGLSPIVTMTGSGSAYTSAPTVTARGGSGTGATFTPTVANGSVTNIGVSNGGTGYLVGESVALTIKGGGSDNMASATATIAATFGVSDVIVNDGGSGYSSLVQVAAVSGSGSPTIPAQFAVIGQAGVITAVTITNPGLGYTSAPTLTVKDLAVGGVGTNAVLTAVMSAGQIASVAVTSVGTGYLSPPTISIVGNGQGAVLQAVLSGTTVGSVSVINAGFNYTRAVLQFSGGNNAASATSMLMPFGVQGNAIATYQSRIWVGDGRNVYVGAPGNPTDFETADGADAFASTDDFLQEQWTQFTQSNGFLYLFGDSSINYISGVQTTGNPPSTTFSNLNVDPQVGTPWHSTVQAFGRNLVFANPVGVYVSYGGAVTKVSDALDGIYTTVPQAQWPPGFEPSAAVANIFGIKVYILVMPIIHPVTGLQVISCLMWDGKRWFTSPQENMTFPFIATQKVNSQLTAYASTDGTSIKPMFSALSNLFTRYLYSKLWDVPGIFTTKMQREIFGLLNVNHFDTAVAATGSVFFSANANDGDVINLNGVPITFRTVAVSLFEVAIGGNAGGTVVNLVNKLAGALAGNANLNVAVYTETGGAATDTLVVTYATASSAGNAYTLQAAAQGRITPLSPTLTGGSDGPQLNVIPLTENPNPNLNGTLVTPNVTQGPAIFGPVRSAVAGKLQGIAIETTMSDIQLNSIELITQNLKPNT